MVKIARNLLIVSTLSLLALSLSGQGGTPDLSGDWTLQATAFLPPGLGGTGGSCTFEGTADVGQDGTSLSGDAALTLVDGSMGCPDQMDASLTGEVIDNQVNMGMLMGQLGETTFNGTLGPNLALQGGGNTLSGTMSVTAGPFAGSTGTWSGVQGTAPVVEVPALSAVGLALLVAILLLVGGVLLRRRSPA
jgi:hypothetical protein